MNYLKLQKIMETQIEQKTQVKAPSKMKVWLKRIGVIGFTFFLIKGLVWIAIFFGIGKLI